MDEQDDHPVPINPTTDTCQQLMDRYFKSSAPQHRHLLATAAAARSILLSESLPLTPASYFAAAMSAASNSDSLDATEVAALLSFLAIALPAVPEWGIAPSKAREAVELLVELLEKRESEKLGVSSVRAGVKCLGVLVGFCDLEDWESVRLGFEKLLKFAVDKRPKVRRCAQECLEKVLGLFQCSPVVKKASKLIFSLVKSYMPLALRLTASSDLVGSKEETPSTLQLTEVLYVLNFVRCIFPSVSLKFRLKIISDIQMLMSSQFSALTSHIHKIIEVFFEASEAADIIMETESIVVSLCSYVSLKENPMDTVICALNLLVNALDKLRTGQPKPLINHLPTVWDSVAGLLTSGPDISSCASSILKELINHHFDKMIFSLDESPKDESQQNVETGAVRTICAALKNVLNACQGLPSENVLSVISALLLKLGESSYTCMRGIILKLADLMTHSRKDTCGTNPLQTCLGSAVVAMGPERMLYLFPLSLDEDYNCKNTWLVPILKHYTVGSSLEYYMENILPLAKSFKQASRKVSDSVLSKELKAHAYELWKLLPSFCRGPMDADKQFSRLAEILAAFLKRKSFMHESVALALKVLVDQNKSVLGHERHGGALMSFVEKEFPSEFQKGPCYSKKTATKNIRALASCSAELLQILFDLFIDADPGRRSYLKDAIVCLASITDSSVTKGIFSSVLGKIRADVDLAPNEEQDNMSSMMKHVDREVILELASSLVEGAKPDLVHIIFNFIKESFEKTNDVGHGGAYHALSRILKEHAWFCSSKYVELVDLLLGLKVPIDIATLTSRFACFHILMVHTLKSNSKEENTRAFLVLNEIILTLKDAKEEVRRVAYDVLLDVSSSFRDKSSLSSEAPHQKLVCMIMGYLSGSSPHIRSAAVSALSVLVYKCPDICLSMPELAPSLLSLLQSKAVEVIKAVLGFVKVLVSSLQPKDLQNLLSDIVAGVVLWSSVSRNHFRSKASVILEIIIRKCGYAAVDFVTPEKYKAFLKSVMENRHSKASKDASKDDTEATPADSSRTRLRKSKHKANGDTANASDYMESKRRKREKKDNLEMSNKRNKSMARSQSNLKGSRRTPISFNAKLPKAQSNTRKRKTEHRNLPKVEAVLNSHGMSRKFNERKGLHGKG